MSIDRNELHIKYVKLYKLEILKLQYYYFSKSLI